MHVKHLTLHTASALIKKNMFFHKFRTAPPNADIEFIHRSVIFFVNLFIIKRSDLSNNKKGVVCI